MCCLRTVRSVAGWCNGRPIHVATSDGSARMHRMDRATGPHRKYQTYHSIWPCRVSRSLRMSSTGCANANHICRSKTQHCQSCVKIIHLQNSTRLPHITFLLDPLTIMTPIRSTTLISIAASVTPIQPHLQTAARMQGKSKEERMNVRLQLLIHPKYMTCSL